MGFLVVIEPTGRGFSAYAPDFDGCVASGATREQVERQIRAVLEFQCAALRQAGETPPAPAASCAWVTVEGPPSGD